MAGIGVTQGRDLLATLQANIEFGWTRLSAGARSQGPRLSNWAFLAINPGPFKGCQRGRLVQRSLDDKREVTAYLTFAPEGTSLENLVLAAYALLVTQRRRQLEKACC